MRKKSVNKLPAVFVSLLMVFSTIAPISVFAYDYSYSYEEPNQSEDTSIQTPEDDNPPGLAENDDVPSVSYEESYPSGQDIPPIDDAYNGDGGNDYLIPSAPTNVSAIAGNNEARVYFTPGDDGGSAVFSFMVTASPGGHFAIGSSSPVTITGLPNDTEYTFTVTATNAIGTSPPSEASNAVIPSEDLATILLTPPEVTISGTAFSGASTTVTTAVTGTATGPITLDASDLPAGVTATVSGTNINITGTRPAEGTIDGVFTIEVMRGGYTAFLTVIVDNLMSNMVQRTCTCCGLVTFTIGGVGGATIAAHTVAPGYPANPVIIPDEILGVPITAIGDRAFSQTTLSAIALPSGLLTIGTGAFYQSPSLTRVDFNHGLQTIGLGAFYNTRLTSVTIPDTVTRILSGQGATATAYGTTMGTTTWHRTFGHNPNLESVTIGSGLRILEPGIFYSSPALQVLELGNATEIREFAFARSGLQSLTIPSYMRILRERAFYRNSSLSVLDIQNAPGGMGLHTIGRGAFFGSSIADLVIPDSVTRIASGTEATTPLPAIPQIQPVYGTSTRIEQLTPSQLDLDLRWHRSFGHNTSLESVTIGTGLTWLEAGIFYDTPNLQAINIPGNVRIIGERAFRVPGNAATGNRRAEGEETGGRGIHSLTLNEGLWEIHRGAFFGAPIEELRIPNSVRRIISGTNGVISITPPALPYGTTLTAETTPTAAELANRWHRSFGHNPYLRRIIIGNQLFFGLPSGNSQLRILEPGVFYGATGLEFLHLGNVDDIRLQAFHDVFLYDVDVEGNQYFGITWNPGYETAVVHTHAFNFVGLTYCQRLRWTITRTGGATITGYNRIHGTELRTLRIPERITDVPEYLPGELPEGVLATPIQRLGGLTITSIGESAFEHRPAAGIAFVNYFHYVFLPDTVHTIHDRAFLRAPVLRGIHLNDGLITIGRGAFFEAVSLLEITIPDTVTRIRSGYTPATVSTIHGNTIGTPPDTHPTNDTIHSFRADVHGRPGPVIGQIPPAWTVPSAQSYARRLGGASAPAGAIVETYAFGRNHSLQSITIGAGLEVIEPGTFYDARLLEVLDLANVKIIGTSAFEIHAAFTSDNLDITWSEPLEIIGPRAFFGANHIPGIDFRETNLRHIRHRAFQNATGIVELYLNDGLIAIHEGAFANASSLRGQPVDADTGTGEDFYPGDDEDLWHLLIPDSVQNIHSGGNFNAQNESIIGAAADWTFADAIALTAVSVGNGTHHLGPQLATINPGTFNGARSLRDLHLGRVAIVGTRAFENAPYLDNITWSPVLTHIHERAFAGSRISGGIEFGSELRRIDAGAFADAGGLEKLVFNHGLVEIRAGAFANATSLRGQPVDPDNPGGDWHLVIPDTVATIGSTNTPAGRTFGNSTAHASALTAVQIGHGVTDIQPGTFFGADNLHTLRIGNNVRTIQTAAFSGAVRLWNITSWGNNLERIESLAFLNMGSIAHNEVASITFPATLEYIGDGAFRNATGIRVLNLNHGLVTIGQGAFYNASRLEELVIPDTVLEFRSANTAGNRTFGNATALTSVTIGQGVLDVPHGAFWNATSLSEIDLGNVLTVGNFAFYGSGRLSSIDDITWSNRISGIGESAFAGSGITAIELPLSMRTIGTNAFADASQLVTLILNEGLTTIGQGAFRNAPYLRGQPVHSGAYSYAYPDNADGDWILIIPDSVTAIISGTGTTLPSATSLAANRTFGGATSLTAIDVGAGLGVIQPGTFWGATSLESVNLRGVERIEAGAFRGISAANPSPLAEIEWGPVNFIGADAFRYNTGLTTIIFPTTMRDIGNHAFSNAVNLSTLELNDGLLTIGMGAFNNARSLTGVLRIPDSVTSISSGTAAPDRTFGGTPVSVSKTQFQYANALDAVIIGNGLTTIPAGMFTSSGVSTVSVGTGVTSIGNQAFMAAGNLRIVTFMGDAPSLGTSAFVLASYPYDFTTRHFSGTLGWSTPLWNGLPAVQIDGIVPQSVRMYAPSQLPPGASVQLTATVYDQFANPMPDVELLWTLDGTGATITQDGLLQVAPDIQEGPVWVRVTTVTGHPISTSSMIWLDGAPYVISTNPATHLIFPNAYLGYGLLETQTITVYNLGTQPTGSLSVALYGANVGRFELLTPSDISNIDVNGNAVIAIRPINGLSVGTHMASIVVSGENVYSRTVNLSFTVMPSRPPFEIALSHQGIDFPVAIVGFNASGVSAQTVTITNTGAQHTGPLTVQVSGANPSRFTLATGNAVPSQNAQLINIPAGIAPGTTATFSIVPRVIAGAGATPVGVQTAVVVVSGANVAASIPIRFEVLSDGIPRITGYSAPNGTVGVSYGFGGDGFIFGGTGSPLPTWSAIGLPPGLVLDSDGLLRGTPTTAGSFTVQVFAANTVGSSYKVITLVIAEPVPILTTLSVANTFASPGGEVTVNFRLHDNTGLANLNLRINFPETLTLIRYNASYTDFNFVGLQIPPGGIGELSFVQAGWYSPQEDFTNNGRFFSLTFLVDEDAAYGILPITVELVTAAGLPDPPRNVNHVPLYFSVINGSVQVMSYVLGDANGDGVVNAADITLIARYAVGHNVEQPDMRAADVVCDGIINLADATRLAQYRFFGMHEVLRYCAFPGTCPRCN
ncbi:MAG: leucine-rich repeat protein [Defluviitaleaceae bacterium]|nr:leucine-rich repeat protein [Defluviitaleaceae bacterium]